MNHDQYDDNYIRGILNSVKSIAMVGASPVNVRPSYFAFKYLAQRGYDMPRNSYCHRFSARMARSRNCGVISSSRSGVSKDEGPSRASWFETRFALLTMRV